MYIRDLDFSVRPARTRASKSLRSRPGRREARDDLETKLPDRGPLELLARGGTSSNSPLTPDDSPDRHAPTGVCSGWAARVRQIYSAAPGQAPENRAMRGAPTQKRTVS